MKKYSCLILFGCLVVSCFSAFAAEIAAANPVLVRGWTISLSGVIQDNPDEWENWYNLDPAGSGDYGWISACNGSQGISLGFDASLDYRISDHFVLGIAAGFVPTRLHAEVHYSTERGIVIEKPKANIPFFPVRITAGYDVFRWQRWSLKAGLQCGLGIFGNKDVLTPVGKARHFSGDNRIMAGVHIRISHEAANGIGYSATLQHLRTGFKAEELGTGEMLQKLNFNPFSLLIGVHYSFGVRKK